VVSHDRYFLDRVVRRIFSFEGNGVLVQHEGGYSDYALRKSMEQGEAAPNSDTAGRTAETKVKAERTRAPRKLKFTYHEQKEYDTIEADIAALEEKIENLENEILNAATDFVKLNKLTAQKEECTQKLEEKMERWMYLEDKAARIQAGELEE